MSQIETPVGPLESQQEPVAGGNQPSSNGFWSSVPRVLTALGGLVTAIGTAAAVYFGGIKGDGNDNGPQPNPAPNPPVVILPQPAPPAPTGSATVTGGDTRTRSAFAGRPVAAGRSDADDIVAEWEAGLNAGTAALAEGCAAGFAGDCQDLIEMLASECEDGDGLSCDVLYLASPSGSALEAYGDSCGGRIPGNDEWCRDLAAAAS